MSVGALVLAGGRGVRLGAEVPKGFVPVAGVPMLVRAIERLCAVAEIDALWPVIPEAERSRCEALGLGRRFAKLRAPVGGGAERQDSVAAGLAALADAAEEVEIVVVHDAARCLVEPRDVARTIAAARAHGAALLARPARDTIKRVRDGVVLGTPPRAECFEAQTPQVFRTELLAEAHAKAAAEGFLGTDDAQLVERLGVAVRVVEGGERNLKITHASDLALAELWLRGSGELEGEVGGAGSDRGSDA